MEQWYVKKTKGDIEKMSRVLDIPPIIARILSNRGLLTKQACQAFLSPDIRSVRPAKLMKDAEKAAALLVAAIGSQKKITVYGDYDVDGVMSTVILYRTLSNLGANVQYYIPMRKKEGYGLNKDTIQRLADHGTQVLLTCDNGISALEEVAFSKRLGLTAIVLDHHEPIYTGEQEHKQDLLPEADAIVDPKQQCCPYPFTALCAAGIAYLFCDTLCQAAGKPFENQEECGVFAGMATICDMVDLLEENRSIVAFCLSHIASCRNIGLRHLLQATNITPSEVTAYHIGYILGPCINAAGRLLCACCAARLFLTEDETEGEKLAQRLTTYNQRRKDLTSQAVEEIVEEINQSPIKEQPIYVLHSEQMEESIAGIVAGRLKEKFYRPVIVLTGSGGLAKGSARSIEGYPIFDELFRCKDYFVRFGGHAMAAGLTLPTENITILRQELNQRCTLRADQLCPIYRVEQVLSFAEINFALAKEIEKLAPFGKGNESPLFASSDVHIQSMRFLGKDKKILKMDLFQNGLLLSGISFDGYDKLQHTVATAFGEEAWAKILNNDLAFFSLDIVYEITLNHFQGKSTLQLQIRDFRLTVPSV